MQPQEVLDRSRRSAGRVRLLKWLALVVIGAALLSSRQAADTTLQTNMDAESEARGSADTALQDRAAVLEHKTQYVSIAGGDMFITGTNLNIRNGLGATNGNPADPASLDPASTHVNGKGNLIVGYNEFGT